MTYMDKILKEFGIERVPLVDTTKEMSIKVTPQHYDIDTYTIEEPLDMSPVAMCDEHLKHKYIAHHSNFVVEKVLQGVSDRVDVQIRDGFDGTQVIRASMDVVTRRS